MTKSCAQLVQVRSMEVYERSTIVTYLEHEQSVPSPVGGGLGRGDTRGRENKHEEELIEIFIHCV